MSRFRVIIQYDGTGFRGWQLQKKDRTVQGELEKSLKKINDNKVVRCLLYTSPSPRDKRQSRMPSSA